MGINEKDVAEMKLGWIGALLLSILFISGCGGSGSSTPAAIEGIWRTDGYGLVLEAVGGRVTIYQNSKVSGIKIIEGTYSGNQMQFGTEVMTGTMRNGKILLDSSFGQYYLTRLTELPDPCKNGGTPMTQDPELNFEVFWHNMNEQYAFFQLRGVNWQHQYDVYRRQVTKNTTPDELYQILCQMITPLNDSHCSISKSENETFRTYDVATALQLQAKANSDSELVKVGAEGYLSYKSLDPKMGLITIFNMGGYNQAGDPDAEVKELDQALEALADKDAIIIDMRFNLGGLDTVSLGLAGRFADQKRLAFSKQARDGDGYTPVREFYVEPQGSRRFTGKVIVLTSRFTVSAGETFIMAMQVLPNVTILGDLTNGAHSDILERVLPNGWSFGLSNERYRAADGQVYEKVGLEPDIKMTFDANEYLSGTDPILQAAIERAAK